MMFRIVLITNHPPPFRIPIYERIGSRSGVDFEAVFCSAREPNRQWDLPPLRFKHTFLRERFVTRGDNFIHNNPDIMPTLRRLAPDVIITTGFNPTFLYAFGYALAKGIPHVPMTDGTDSSEQALSRAHRMLRQFVYSRSKAFISASVGGWRLYESYGVSAEHWFQSCLCIDNQVYLQAAATEKKTFDFLFCGRMVQDKNPLFALRVAADVARRLGKKMRILFVGSGDQEEEVKAEAAAQPGLVEAEFNGHAHQHELPALYRSARVFLFPTLRDVWGVVANEACAAELPILVSPHAGVSGELVIDGENGFVRPLDVATWGEHAALLLTNLPLYQRFAHHSGVVVRKYTFDHAAHGIVDACSHALGKRIVEDLKQPARKTG